MCYIQHTKNIYVCFYIFFLLSIMLIYNLKFEPMIKSKLRIYFIDKNYTIATNNLDYYNNIGLVNSCSTYDFQNFF